MEEQKIIVTGKMALSKYAEILKYAVKHVKGYANRILISKAAKQIEAYAELKNEERDTLLTVFGIEKDGNWVIDHISLQKAGGEAWIKYNEMKKKLLTEFIEIEAFSIKLQVDIPESALVPLSSDEIQVFETFFVINAIPDEVKK